MLSTAALLDPGLSLGAVDAAVGLAAEALAAAQKPDPGRPG